MQRSLAGLIFAALALALAVAVLLPPRRGRDAVPEPAPGAPAAARASEPAVAAPRAADEERALVHALLPAAASLEGLVVDGEDQPVPGAAVLLLRGDPRDPESALVLAETRSDAGGAFALAVPAGAQIFLGASARGFEDAVHAIGGGGPEIVRMTRWRAATRVRGRVLDEAGRVLPWFEALEHLAEGDGRDWRMERAWHRVVQGPDGFDVELGGSTDPPTFAARAPGCAQAVRQGELGPDGVLDVGDVVLPRAEPCFGRVVDPGGRPVGGAFVLARMEKGPAPESAETSAADGAFHLAPAAGARIGSLVVEAEGFATRWVRPEETGGAWEDLVIALAPGATLTGRVTRGGAPLGRSRVQAWMLDDSGASSPWRPTATADAGGRYAIERVPAGRVAAGVLGGDDAVRAIEVLTLAPGEVLELDFELGLGVEARGAIELPFADPMPLGLAILARDRDGALRPCAELRGEGGAHGRPSAFRVDDVRLPRTAESVVLRISWAPGLHVDREVLPTAGAIDFGLVRFATLDAMREFERGGARLHERR